MDPLSVGRLLVALSSAAGASPQPQPRLGPSEEAGDVSPLIAAALAAVAASNQQRSAPEPAPAPVVEAVRLPWIASVIAALVAVAFTLSLFATTAVMAFMTVPAGHPLLPLLALFDGGLMVMLAAVVFYLFGSSLGSSRKTELIGRAAQPAVRAAPAPLVLPPVTPAPQLPPTPPPPSSRTDVEDNFLKVAPVIDVWEGGFSNHPDDPGGPTKHGITQAVLSRWLGRQVSVEDVKALTLPTAHEIFRENYWKPLICDQLPLPIALMTYNCGVNSGVYRGAKFLQQTLNNQGAGLDVDGEVGPLTVAAAAKVDLERAVLDYAATYEAFYRGLSTFRTFGRGWLNRLNAVKEQALTWAGEEPTRDTPAPKPTTPAPWFDVATSLLGLEEVPGSGDNQTIIEMAKRIGGQIAETYTNDAIPWCALFANYCLHAAGFQGTGALLALDFTGDRFSDRFTRLSGPAVGAIATKHRSGGGGHVFFVVGRTSSGKLVGRGGNQSDTVNDETFSPSDVVGYVWPKDAEAPTSVGFSTLPVVSPQPHVKRAVKL